MSTCYQENPVGYYETFETVSPKFGFSYWIKKLFQFISSVSIKMSSSVEQTFINACQFVSQLQTTHRHGFRLYKTKVKYNQELSHSNMAPDEIEAPRVRCFRLTIYARKWCQSTPIYWYQLHCCLGFLFITTQLLLRYTQIQVYRALLSAHSSLVLIFVIDVSKTEMVTLVLHWDKKKYISLNRLFVFQLSWYRIWRYLIIYI